MRIPPGPLTNILVAINVVIGLLLIWPPAWEASVMAGALIPARFSGGNSAYLDIPYLLPVWLTPFSSAFLHGGVLHLVLNMAMLLLMGRMTERVLGWQGLGILYVAGIIAAAAVEFLAHPSSQTPVIGASGAISAVIAVYMLLFPNKEPKPWGPIPVAIARPLQLLAMWVLINLMIGFAGPGMGLGIAIWSHIGGFIAGLLLARPLLRWRYRKA
jgi:membrane associated rhomboid family serine protease